MSRPGSPSPGGSPVPQCGSPTPLDPAAAAARVSQLEEEVRQLRARLQRSEAIRKDQVVKFRARCEQYAQKVRERRLARRHNERRRHTRLVCGADALVLEARRITELVGRDITFAVRLCGAGADPVVELIAPQAPAAVLSEHEFVERLAEMREAFARLRQAADAELDDDHLLESCKTGPSDKKPEPVVIPLEDDPWLRAWDAEQDVGCASLWVGALAHNVDIEPTTAKVLTDSGVCTGEVTVSAALCDSDGNPREREFLDDGESHALIGEDWYVKLLIERVAGFGSDAFREVRVSYCWWDSEERTTPIYPAAAVLTPAHAEVHGLRCVGSDFASWLENGSVIITVHGQRHRPTGFQPLSSHTEELMMGLVGLTRENSPAFVRRQAEQQVQQTLEQFGSSHMGSRSLRHGASAASISFSSLLNGFTATANTCVITPSEDHRRETWPSGVSRDTSRASRFSGSASLKRRENFRPFPYPAGGSGASGERAARGPSPPSRSGREAAIADAVAQAEDFLAAERSAPYPAAQQAAAGQDTDSSPRFSLPSSDSGGEEAAPAPAGCGGCDQLRRRLTVLRSQQRGQEEALQRERIRADGLSQQLCAANAAASCAEEQLRKLVAAARSLQPEPTPALGTPVGALARNGNLLQRRSLTLGKRSDVRAAAAEDLCATTVPRIIASPTAAVRSPRPELPPIGHSPRPPSADHLGSIPKVLSSPNSPISSANASPKLGLTRPVREQARSPRVGAVPALGPGGAVGGAAKDRKLEGPRQRWVAGPWRPAGGH